MDTARPAHRGRRPAVGRAAALTGFPRRQASKTLRERSQSQKAADCGVTRLGGVSRAGEGGEMDSGLVVARGRREGRGADEDAPESEGRGGGLSVCEFTHHH